MEDKPDGKDAPVLTNGSLTIIVADGWSRTVIIPFVHEAPGRAGKPGTTHLSRHGGYTLCGRWVAATWLKPDAPARPICRRCAVIAKREGFLIPAVSQEVAP